MRCEDVIRELAALEGTPAKGDLADHLARCPRCAALAGRDARLDRLWEATRPPALPDSAWERIWARVSEEFDRQQALVPVAGSPALVPVPASTRPWRRAFLSAFVVAQAAAILIGAVLLTREGKATTTKIVIEQGAPVTISLDGPSPRPLAIARNEDPNAVDELYDLFNRLEGIAELQ